MLDHVIHCDGIEMCVGIFHFLQLTSEWTFTPDRARALSYRFGIESRGPPLASHDRA